MRELLAPHGVEAISAGELGLGEPEETGDTFRANARDQGDRRGQGRATAGLRRRFRPRGRCARRRARDFLGALGRTEQGFHRRDDADRAPAAGARRHDARRSARRISSPRCASPGPTVISRRSRRAPTARWCGRRAAPPASATTRVPARRTYAHLRRDDQPSKSTACRRAGSGLSHRARAFVKLAEICLDAALTAEQDASASTCTGRSACRNARIAISTAMSATRRSTKSALPARSRARSKPPRRARRAARSPRSFSAAARRR